jgi:hypothetical protein
VLGGRFLQKLALSRRRTGGSNVHFSLELEAALVTRPKVPNATLVDVFGPLSSNDGRAALGARSASHWTSPLRPAPLGTYAMRNRSQVKAGIANGLTGAKQRSSCASLQAAGRRGETDELNEMI